MSSHDFDSVAKGAQQKASDLEALIKQIKSIHHEVKSAIGGSASGADRHLAALLDQAAKAASDSKQAFVDASTAARQAAGEARRAEAEASKSRAGRQR